jgi:hypothetical protein
MRRKVLAAAILIPALLTVNGCGRAGDHAAGSRLIHENGIPVMVSSGIDLFGPSIFQFERILTLEQDPGVEKSLIARPVAFSMDHQGNYYVLDNGDMRIAVFGSDGRYLRSFGRSGSGPGEFRFMELVRHEADQLSIWDPNNQRVTVYRTDGRFLESYRSPGTGYSVRCLKIQGDRYLGWLYPGREEDGFAYTQTLVQIRDAGGDTLATIESGETITGIQRTMETPAGLGFMRMSIPFVGSPMALYDGGSQIVCSSGGTPEVRWFDLEGHLVRIARLEIEPRPVTAEIMSAYEEKMSSSRVVQRSGGRAPQPEIQYPPYLGFWTRSLLDDDGRLWLNIVLSPQEEERFGPYRWLILDQEGRFLGSAVTPSARIRIVGDRLLSIESDPATDEPVLAVYRFSTVIDLAVPGSR